MNTRISDAAVSAGKTLTDSQVRQWIDVCNHEPARQFLRDALAARQPAKPEAVRLRDELRERGTLAATLRAMATNYSGGHSWDHLDADVCRRAADALASVQPSPADPALGRWRSAEGVSLADTRAFRVYIAGPMTGYENYNFPAFNAAAEVLLNDGYTPVNPADHGVVEGAGWEDYLRDDIAKLATCEAAYFLPGWSKSKGAQLEHHIATALGMTITYAPGAEDSLPQPSPAGQGDALAMIGSNLRSLLKLAGELPVREAVIRANMKEEIQHALKLLEAALAVRQPVTSNQIVENIEELGVDGKAVG